MVKIKIRGILARNRGIAARLYPNPRNDIVNDFILPKCVNLKIFGVVLTSIPICVFRSKSGIYAKFGQNQYKCGEQYAILGQIQGKSGGLF